jgi:hypothetical protein
MSGLVFVVAALATYSLTLLVACDKVTDRPRQWVLTRISGHGYAGESGPGAYLCACGAWDQSLDAVLDHVHDARQQVVDAIPMSKRAALLYLFRCPWCCSAWIAAPVAWSAWCFGDRAWWFIPALALGMRATTGAAAQYANPRS